MTNWEIIIRYEMEKAKRKPEMVELCCGSAEACFIQFKIPL